MKCGCVCDAGHGYSATAWSGRVPNAKATAASCELTFSLRRIERMCERTVVSDTTRVVAISLADRPAIMWKSTRRSLGVRCTSAS